MTAEEQKAHDAKIAAEKVHEQKVHEQKAEAAKVAEHKAHEAAAHDPRSDPAHKDYDPAFALKHPRPLAPVTTSLQDLNGFKMDLKPKFESLSADIAQLRASGAGVKDFDRLQKKLSDLRLAVHSFGS